MAKRTLVLLSFATILFISGCGDDGGTAGGKWVGEAFEGSSSTVVGEFGSYDECLEETKAAAKSGVFNCGVK